MEESLKADELAALVRRVFRPSPADRAVAILVDLPDASSPDNDAWRQRRTMASGWVRELDLSRGQLGLETHLCLYRNVRANNADLPGSAWLWSAEALPSSADEPDPAAAIPFDEIFRSHGILVAVTEFSATAPLKLLARKFSFRAATMPGFSPAMIPALRLDYDEIHRRVMFFKDLLDRAARAEIAFNVRGGARHRLTLDLRHRTAHASSGLLAEAGTAGNLPSGEAYIVPYEGELPGQPSATSGELPVQFGSEVVVYTIEENRARRVNGSGEAARREADLLDREPAYGNMAELGLGVLGDFGVQPCGSILLDEKLGLHLAFGRSDHFGGQVSPAQFTAPEAVVHIDRIYLPSVQPKVEVERMVLFFSQGASMDLIRNNRYVVHG